MPTSLEKKRIIIIHGLASKPPEETWLELNRRCLIENVRLVDSEVADALAGSPGVFRSAYWADAVPHHIPDDAVYCRGLSVQVDEVIQERRDRRDDFHVGAGDRMGAFFKDRGLDVVKVFSSALTIKDNVMKAMLEETRVYAEEQFLADRIRAPLESALRSAWDDNCDVTLISHSMGTFAAFDVLWRYSHRETEPYRSYRNRKVQMFVTMGSPLSDSAVRGLLFARFHQGHGARQFPTNFQMWHNYVALGDVVSHGADFAKDYFEGLRASQVIPADPAHCLIEYKNLHNPFRDVTHGGNSASEKRNPHKEYGYLVQPRLGSWLVDFLKGNLQFNAG